MKFIRNYLESDLLEFEKTFNNAVHSHVALLDTIMKYVVKSKGKQLRPMFVFLTAKLCGECNDVSYRAASLIELLHTATLVHDDVVDDANKRRSFFSINALWKNKIAVLVGDYLLSKGLLLSLNNNDFTILKILSKAVSDMSEGELLQIEKARKLDITEEVYFDIIQRKTASLISAACAAGAYAGSNGNEEKTNLLKNFGEKIGIAFQIKDDLFDYGNVDIGKPTGNDIKEKKMTLPLIYTLNNCDKNTASRIKKIFKQPEKNKKELAYIIDAVQLNGGIKYAEEKMNLYRDEAFELLAVFEESEPKKYLKELVNYTTERKY
jgi:octaprenyl-diphosphate synthase